MLVTLEAATLPDPSDTRAFDAVKLPVVIVETAPAMLAVRLASTAVVAVSCKVTLAALLASTAASPLLESVVEILVSNWV